MTLWGVGLGLGLGVAYGLLVGYFTFFPVAMLVGPLLGALYGTIVGLPLGVLEGVVLWVVTVLRHRGDSPDVSLRYRRVAESCCVAACVLAVVLFWGITFGRPGNDSFSIRVAFTRDLLEAFIVVVGPSILATGATWWAARRVASQYARQIAATRHQGVV